MSNDPPGGIPVSDESVSAMAARINSLRKEHPQSLLADLEPGSLRNFYEKMASGVRADASQEKIFCTALRVAESYPPLFTKAYPSIKELTSSQLHEFSHMGTLPRKRRGPTK
jgi:hypothetical protein